MKQKIPMYEYLRFYIHCTSNVLFCISAHVRQAASTNVLLVLYHSAVVFKPVLQAPLPCTFCMSPLSDTPDSTHQLVSRDCKT